MGSSPCAGDTASKNDSSNDVKAPETVLSNPEDVPLPLFRTVKYPDLSHARTPARQRKPGLTKQPSYTTSPINSFARSPANISRRRANAVSLANSPARRSASAGMASIWRLSQDTLRFQDEAKKQSAVERREEPLFSVSMTATKENTPLVKGTIPAKQQQQITPPVISTYLPEVVLVDRLSDDIPAGLTVRTRPSKREPIRIPVEMREPYLAMHSRSSSGETSSSVESWLSRLASPEELEPQTPANTSVARLLPQPLSPGAQTHRICASASSIAKRIQLRSPQPSRHRVVSPCSKTDDEMPDLSAGLLSRLLRPAVRKPSSSQPFVPEKSKVITSNSKDSTISPASKDGPTVQEEPSPRSSTPSESGSSEVLYLPKVRQPKPVRSPFDRVRTPKAKAKAKAAQRSDPDDEADGTRRLTPEVKVFRRGRKAKKEQNGRAIDGDVLGFRVLDRADGEQHGTEVGAARCNDGEVGVQGHASAGVDMAATRA